MNKDSNPAIRGLYPHSDAEIRETEDKLDQYLSLVLRIYERLASDPESHAQLRTLTGTGGTLGCTPQRSEVEDHPQSNP